MNREKETYNYHLESTDEEIQLKDSILTEEIKKNRDVETATNNILKLSFVKQLQIVHGTLDKEYSINNTDDEYVTFIGKLLGQKCFNDHRSIILKLVNNDESTEKLKEFEEKYNINIVDTEK